MDFVKLFKEHSANAANEIGAVIWANPQMLKKILYILNCKINKIERDHYSQSYYLLVQFMLQYIANGWVKTALSKAYYTVRKFSEKFKSS